jgi:hypothetical protein
MLDSYITQKRVTGDGYRQLTTFELDVTAFQFLSSWFANSSPLTKR